VSLDKIDEIDESFDIKQLIKVLLAYRYMILFFTFLFLLASSYYAYFKQDIYKASTTIEVGIDGSRNNDVLSRAIRPSVGNADTEKEIIQSRFLSQKAAQKVDIIHRYYTTLLYKERELYKETPFHVGMIKGYGASFDFYPIDQKSYRLVSKKWKYDHKHLYGEEVDTPFFHLNIIRVKEPRYKKYRFVVFDPQKAGALARGHVSVGQRSKYSTVLRIAYEDNVALRAQEFANALAQAYLEQNIEKKTKEATRKLVFIDKQLKLITQNLKGSAIKLEEFKRNSNTVNLSSKAENIIRQMSEQERKLAEVSMEEKMLSTLYGRVKSGKDLASLALVNSSLSQQALGSMVKELQSAILKKKILREDYTEMYPEVVKLRRTITQLKQLIISTISNLQKSIKEREKLFQKSIAKLQKELNKLPADERMFGQLQRKFAINEKIYSYLLEKRSETAIIKASTVSKNRILDRALTPSSPIKPKRKLMVIVGTFLGLFVGIVLAFLFAFMDNRIKNEEDLDVGGEIALLGTIPHIEHGAEELKVFSSPKSALAESFRHLRTNLQFMQGVGDSHVITLTSTISNEGKSTVAMNLAGIMSMTGKRTIILNLDMRKPTLHTKFSLDNTKGMSTLLSKHATLAEVIQHTAYENLDMITSGPTPPNPSELIQSSFMFKVLEKLREVYDVIIIDTPPIGLVTDARTLMYIADTSLYLLRANYSKKEFLKHIKSLAKEHHIKHLGIILNDVPLEKRGYGYGYGYYEEDKG
jgi:capsular exopolysaccharide synthesis family protein